MAVQDTLKKIKNISNFNKLIQARNSQQRENNFYALLKQNKSIISSNQADKLMATVRRKKLNTKIKASFCRLVL